MFFGNFFDLCKRKYTLEKTYLQTVNADTPEYRQLICFSHVKHLVSVFLKNRSAKAGLSASQQIQKIREVLSDPLTVDVLEQYCPQGAVMKVVTFVFKRQWATAAYLLIAIGAKYI